MRDKQLSNNFEFTACDNTKCLDHKSCKHYIMFAKYNATDIKTGSGTATKCCKRYLPIKKGTNNEIIN